MSRLAQKIARLDQGADVLFDEKGIASAALGQLFLEVVQRSILPEQSRDELAGHVVCESVQPQFDRSRHREIASVVVRAVGEHDERRCGHAGDEAIEELARVGGHPLQIFVGEDQWPVGGDPTVQPQQRFDHLTPAFLVGQRMEWIARGQRVQNGQRRDHHTLRFAAERDDAAGHFLPYRVRIVRIQDVEILAQDLHAGTVAGAAAVRRRAAVEHQHVLAGERAHELVDKP